ncbi:MAG TPA: hypothetical protein PKC28_04650 [Bdellovibrionales bacterium]|nr:hypothetical protein [Bdellovibrionales bacterium]
MNTDQPEYSSSDILQFATQLYNSFGAILGYTELLRKETCANQRRRRLEAIKEVGLQSIAEIEQWLPRGEPEPLEETPFTPQTLAELARRATQSCRRLAASKNVELDLQIKNPVLPYPLAESARLGHILFHLINDALIFTSKGVVTVTVGTTSRGPRQFVVFSVKQMQGTRAEFKACVPFRPYYLI